VVQLAIQVDKNEHYPVQSTPKSNIYGEYPKRESKRRCERQLYEKNQRSAKMGDSRGFDLMHYGPGLRSDEHKPQPCMHRISNTITRPPPLALHHTGNTSAQLSYPLLHRLPARHPRSDGYVLLLVAVDTGCSSSASADCRYVRHDLVAVQIKVYRPTLGDPARTSPPASAS